MRTDFEGQVLTLISLIMLLWHDGGDREKEEKEEV
jgi:hypothetical protein